ncbi:hypothetical protein M426DRAFT_318473 [Hypoxylon sp. CI-4A]|nr:hypothetical protein M426DRAFT_318473 [Hypoxylon sp. CI-4A]
MREAGQRCGISFLVWWRHLRYSHGGHTSDNDRPKAWNMSDTIVMSSCETRFVILAQLHVSTYRTLGVCPSFIDLGRCSAHPTI